MTESENAPLPSPKQAARESVPSREHNFPRWILGAVAGGVATLTVLYISLPYWWGSVPEKIRARMVGFSNVKTLSIENKEKLKEIKENHVLLEKSLDSLQADVKHTLEKLNELKLLNTKISNNRADIENLTKQNIRSMDSEQNFEKLTVKLSMLEKSFGDWKKGDASQRSEITRRKNLYEGLKLDLEAVRTRIDNIETKIVQLNKQKTPLKHADALIIATSQFREALLQARPFSAEIEILNKFVGDDQEIKQVISTVQTYALDGIPTRLTLLVRLSAVIRAAIAADSGSEKSIDWTDRIYSKLRNSITVRRVDGQGDGIQGVVSRAENAARKGDLLGTVEHLDSLSGPARRAVSSWLAIAKARLAADEARANLGNIILKRVIKSG